MPSSINQTVKEIVLEAHEDRLQTLEQGHGQVSKQVAVLTEQVTTGFKILEDKIENTIAPFADKLTQHLEAEIKAAEFRAKLMDQVEEHEEYISGELAKESLRKARVAGFGKGIWSLILLGVGAAIKEIVVAVLKHHAG